MPSRQPSEPSTLELKIMLVIIRQHPHAYGVSIQEGLAQHGNGKQHALGSIYAALERLEEKRFVKSSLGAPSAERGGKRKLYFELTTVGSAVVQNCLNTFDALRTSSKLAGVYSLSANLGLNLRK